MSLLIMCAHIQYILAHSPVRVGLIDPRNLGIGTAKKKAQCEWNKYQHQDSHHHWQSFAMNFECKNDHPTENDTHGWRVQIQQRT